MIEGKIKISGKIVSNIIVDYSLFSELISFYIKHKRKSFDLKSGKFTTLNTKSKIIINDKNLINNIKKLKQNDLLTIEAEIIDTNEGLAYNATYIQKEEIYSEYMEINDNLLVNDIIEV